MSITIETGTVRLARDTLAALEKEHGDLLTELNRVVDWLDDRQIRESSPFPPPQAPIVSASNRMNVWNQSLNSILLDLPETVESSSHLSVRPPLRSQWMTQTPRSAALEAFLKQGAPEVKEGLAHLERQHQSIVGEIERAREVVAFASETARAETTVDVQIEREGMENALSLLRFHRDQIKDLPPEVERSFVSGLCSTFLRTRAGIDEGRFGVLRQVARYGLPEATRKLSRRLISRTRALTREGVAWSKRAYRGMLVRVGWVPISTSRVRRVVARGYLTNSLKVENRREQLPMIYQRLFRLTPVEDPRFLIGRQEELDGLAQACELWRQGRDAGVLIVGERGSGKTSLINCALQRVLTGYEVVRSEFSSRLTRPEEMCGFLGELLGVEGGAVQDALQSRQRIIVLEELERTFLRRIQHYGAIRTLLNLVSSSSRSTLWILSVNHFAFRLLNASLRLDPHFSHRINAMAVDRESLRDTILMRHNLSGLRLRFAPAPRNSPYSTRLRQVTGVDDDPENVFFDALHRESGGVFRAAFALWQRYIDRAEAGILYMRHPARPQYEDVMNNLSNTDIFTLTAILQHGSLTSREHGIIFKMDDATSNACLDNLLARELIEPDPGRQGLRVVPEAGQIVRQTLFERNLG